MQILSTFCLNKHLTRLYDNSVLSRYFTQCTNAFVIQQCYCYCYSQKYYYKLQIKQIPAKL